VLVTNVDLVVASGSSKPIGELNLPCKLHPGETNVHTFHLFGSAAGKPLVGASARLRSVVITVESVVLFGSQASDGPDGEGIAFKNPTIITKWDTGVDFDMVLPAAAAAAAHLTSKSAPNRSPVALTNESGTLGTPFLGGSGDMPAFKRPGPRPLPASSIMTAPHSTRSQKSFLTGITLTFIGPSVAKVGEVVTWTVFAINKSHVQRSLSLVFLPEDHIETQGSRTSTLRSVMNADADIVTAATSARKQGDAVIERGIISLVNDVKIGPMQPNSCAEVEISLLALVPGIHTLDNVTLVDLVTSDGYDCRRIIKVVVEDP
jgi:hypothetical protein